MKTIEIDGVAYVKLDSVFTMITRSLEKALKQELAPKKEKTTRKYRKRKAKDNFENDVDDAITETDMAGTEEMR